MCEILIKAIDATHADPVKDRRGCYKKGYPVVVFEDGHRWGSEEGPPTFIVLKIPGLSKDAAMNYIENWADDFDYEIVATRPAQGEFDVRIFEKNTSTSGLNAITQAKAEAFLLRWGCSGISESANSVAFTFNLWNAARSEGFWEVPLIGTKATFQLNSYSSATGIASITATITDESLKEEQVIRRITDRGGTVTANAFPAVTYELERSDILTKFRADVKRRGQTTFCRRKYQLPTIDVDSALAGDGTLTLTQAEVIAKIKDKLTE